MERFDIYKDISERTGGDVYLGVVGPVRTGKSTFITKFMEKIVLPNINNKLQKQIATDEMPQSADGKTIMTTQPKFVPANAVKVQFKNKTSVNVRLVDCVGYLVEGAVGHEEDSKPRLVKTPWAEEQIPFETAAEIGTKKVIEEYSTVGIVVTSDGSFGEIPRQNYLLAEKRVIEELKLLNKPFIIILNTNTPTASATLKIAQELEEEYGVSVIIENVSTMEEQNFSDLMEKILFEFPMDCFNVNIPKWMQALPSDNQIIAEILDSVKENSKNISKMRDYAVLCNCFDDSENFNCPTVSEIKLGEGIIDYDLASKDGLFYKVLSSECGDCIKDDYELMSFIKTFSQEKRKFEKIKDALYLAEQTGYGVVLPSVDEMNLEEPTLVKQGGKYGVKLKASAPSLHIMKVDVNTEVSPVVGTEKQGEELVNSLMKKFEDNPVGLWETNLFGKPLHELVNDELAMKLNAMPKEAQCKMRKTLSKIVNENRGGIICILI